MRHSGSCPIAIAQELSGPNHFEGVDDALRARGVEPELVVLGEAPGRLGEHTRVVAVSDVRSFLALGVLRRAQHLGASTVLLMDGIADFRAVFADAGAGPGYLRPAPVDVVACAGRNDARWLADLGNDVVATGLPRLAGLVAGALAPQPAILVATPTRVAFSDDERRRLASALAILRDRLGALAIPTRWRLTGGLELELGVPLDDDPLAETLAAVSAVITTPSTLLVQAMRAGRPTALLDPFVDPCWPRAVWRIDEQTLAHPRTVDAFVGALLAPTDRQRRRQQRILARMHEQDSPPAEAVADLLLEVAVRRRPGRHLVHVLDPTRLPHRVAAQPGRPRVVSVVRCDVSPVGGVTTWSQRLARVFADNDLGYDVRTLLVVTHPDSLPAPRTIHDGGLTQVCVVDPLADHWQAVRTVRRALERLEPTLVLPNYADLCYAAAMQLRPQGTRVIAIAHTDHASCRNVTEFYKGWDGAVGVSGSCMEWLTPMAGHRPVARIVYGVPVADAPRAVEPAGPLKLAYVGRMVETQKRISDLLVLIDGLETRGVVYELHVVGDGEDLDAWRRSLARRSLTHGRVILHGRQSAAWVERFLSHVDVSVLVSDFEGTSITMLEAMGAGVVPAVTRVRGGVDEWIRDGVNGLTVPVGKADLMADRLAALAADRPAIASMGRAAWETVRGPISIEAMARQYRAFFDAVTARPVEGARTDAGLRLCDHYTWCKEWVEHGDEALAWIESVLREAGYRDIAIDEPGPHSDAVIVKAGGGVAVEQRVEAYRARGLGVAVWPHLIESPVTDRMHRVMQSAIDDGCSRIAIYGIGKHTQRTSGIFDRGLPLVGLIDDCPPRRPRVFGLPVVPMGRVMSELKPDAVVLSSDAWEPQLWQRAAPLRRAGVRVLPLYGTYE